MYHVFVESIRACFSPAIGSWWARDIALHSHGNARESLDKSIEGDEGRSMKSHLGSQAIERPSVGIRRRSL
jgi:hypothetical protein